LACRCETAGMVINVTVGTYVHTGKYDIFMICTAGSPYQRESKRPINNRYPESVVAKKG
jgi:hypothetical protein